MSYEYEPRKEAYRLCREEGFGIKAALSTTIDNTEHLQLISIANSRSGGGGGDYAALEGEDLGLPDDKEETGNPKHSQPHRRSWLSRTDPKRDQTSGKGTGMV